MKLYKYLQILEGVGLSGEVVFRRAVEQGLGLFVTPALAERLALLSAPIYDLSVRSAELEEQNRSHLSYAFELVELFRSLRRAVSSETDRMTEVLPYEEDNIAFEAALFLEDIGKAYTPATARLYSLENLDSDSMLWDVLMEYLGAQYASTNAEEIAAYVRKAKIAFSEFYNSVEGAREWRDKSLRRISMRDFWDAHVYWSYEILRREKENIRSQWPRRADRLASTQNFDGIFAGFLQTVNSHHFLDGYSLVREADITERDALGELLDKLHAFIRRTPAAQTQSRKERMRRGLEYLRARIAQAFSFSGEGPSRAKYESAFGKISTAITASDL